MVSDEITKAIVEHLNEEAKKLQDHAIEYRALGKLCMEQKEETLAMRWREEARKLDKQIELNIETAKLLMK